VVTRPGEVIRIAMETEVLEREKRLKHSEWFPSGQWFVVS